MGKTLSFHFADEAQRCQRLVVRPLCAFPSKTCPGFQIDLVEVDAAFSVTESVVFAARRKPGLVLPIVRSVQLTDDR